jgi:hypothetical protein
MMALMIVSLIALLGLRVVYNNEIHRVLKIDRNDLYKDEINYKINNGITNKVNFEEIISEINIYSIENKLIIDDIKKEGIRQDILGKAATILYLKDRDIFEIIYNKGIRYGFNIRYKVVDGNIFFLPEEEYIVLERK